MSPSLHPRGWSLAHRRAAAAPPCRPGLDEPVAPYIDQYLAVQRPCSTAPAWCGGTCGPLEKCASAPTSSGCSEVTPLINANCSYCLRYFHCPTPSCPAGGCYPAPTLRQLWGDDRIEQVTFRQLVSMTSGKAFARASMGARYRVAGVGAPAPLASPPTRVPAAPACSCSCLCACPLTARRCLRAGCIHAGLCARGGAPRGSGVRTCLLTRTPTKLLPAPG